MALIFKARVMDQPAFERTLVRIAHQIIEKNSGAENLCLVGINTRGRHLARRLAANIQTIEGSLPPVGWMHIAHDPGHAMSCQVTAVQIPFPLEGKTVILVDEVIFTCRTARAAMDALFTVGQPARVQLFCMIDRGHAQLPIKATFVGKNLPTSLREMVRVELEEVDQQTGVSIYQIAEPDGAQQ